MPFEPATQALIDAIGRLSLKERRRFLARQRRPFPRLVYKYRPASSQQDLGRIRSILLEHQLWLAPRSTFNDPFDGRFEITAAGSAWHRERKMRQLLQDQHPGLRGKALREAATRFARHLTPEAAKQSGHNAMATMGICALGTDAKNLLMWSHYGASHSGIAIGFDVAVGYDPFAAVQGVDYIDEYVTINYLETKARLQEGLSKAMVRKSSVWEYEKECRIIQIAAANVPLPIRAPDSVCMLIYGCGVSDESRRMVQEVLREREALGHRPLRELQAVRLRSRYGLRLQAWSAALARQPDGFY